MKKLDRCAVHWLSLYEKFGKENVKVWAAAFVTGNAEKVAMGACRGAMSAPAKADADWFRETHKTIAEEYGLQRYEYARVNRREFWLLRDEKALALLKRGINDNVTRAYICGLDPDLIDVDYVLEAPEYIDTDGIVR